MLVDQIAGVLINLVPAGLVVALAFFLRLAMTSKTWRSLQAQLSVFMSVWIVAELVRALVALGLIRGSADLTTIGIVIHTSAMVLFGVFIILRIYRVSAAERWWR